MSIEILPVGTTDNELSSEGFILGGQFTTVQLVGNVTTTSLAVQHRLSPGVWRDLVEEGVTRQLDVDNSAVRVRGPLYIRVQRRGTESCGCTASNWAGNGNI